MMHMKTFEGVATSLCTFVSPPSLPSFLSTSRGLSRRRHFTHVDQLSDSGGRNYYCQTDHRRWHHNTAHIVKEKKETMLFTCVCHSVCSSWEEGGRCSVSPLQWPTTGYRLNSDGRPVLPTLRGRRLCPRGCRCHKTPGDRGGSHLQLNTSDPVKAFPGASRRS